MFFVLLLFIEVEVQIMTEQAERVYIDRSLFAVITETEISYLSLTEISFSPIVTSSLPSILP